MNEAYDCIDILFYKSYPSFVINLFDVYNLSKLVYNIFIYIMYKWTIINVIPNRESYILKFA